jgi:hypothetical protein
MSCQPSDTMYLHTADIQRMARAFGSDAAAAGSACATELTRWVESVLAGTGSGLLLSGLSDQALGEAVCRVERLAQGSHARVVNVLVSGFSGPYGPVAECLRTLSAERVALQIRTAS